MKKFILVALLMIFVVTVTSACGQQPTAASDTGSAEEQEAVSAQQTLITSLVVNPQVVFEESKEDITGNKGEYIAVDTERDITEDGIVFHAGSDENPFFAFAKSQTGTTGNQAVYVKFLPSAKDFGFMLSEETGIGITIGEENEPCYFLQNGANIIPITTEMRIEPGNWYHVVLCIDTTGAFQGVICKDGALDQAAYFSVSADDTEGENRVDKSWQLYAGFHGEATLTIQSYCLYTFDSYVK
ncbi:MAG TPA: hypothetical protein VN453_01975 [Feifaniaceae bacterium]|nr:hypothetical protein [Feifaniaceae bacterium]